MNRNLRRMLSYGTNATLVTFFVVALVVVVFGVADRHRVRWDLSEGGANKLQRDTLNKIRLLDQAGEPVQITAFSAQDGKKESIFKNREMQDLLDELEYSSKVIRSRFIDFDRERLTAEALGVTMYATIVVQRGEERVDLRDRDLFRHKGKGEDRSMEFLGEAALNQAFSRLMSKEKRVVYTLMGHGELDLENTEPGGLSSLKDLLEQEHYEIKPLDLIRDREEGSVPKVPDDASALLLARPRTALSAPEVDALMTWLSLGGRMLVLADVGYPVPSFLSTFGVSVAEGMVMDKRLVFPYNDRPVPVYRSHPITEDLLQDDLVTVLSTVAPIKVASPPPEGVVVFPLLRTSRDGWIDRGGELVKGAAVFEETFDEKGPAEMAQALEIQPGKGIVYKGPRYARLVVVGDGDFMTNGVVPEGPGNATFIVNAFRWLVGDDDRLSVVGRPTTVRRLALTDEDTRMIRWVALGLGPLCVFLAGAAVWAARRGR